MQQHAPRDVGKEDRPAPALLLVLGQRDVGARADRRRGFDLLKSKHSVSPLPLLACGRLAGAAVRLVPIFGMKRENAQTVFYKEGDVVRSWLKRVRGKV